MAVFVFRGSCYTRFCEDMKQRERERESISSSLFFIWSLQPCQTFMVFKRSWLQAMGKPRPPAAVLSSSSSSRRQLRLTCSRQQEPRFETPSSYHSSTCSREMSRTSLRSATSALWDVFHFFWMGCCVWLIQDTSEKGDPLSSGFHQVHLLIIS